MDEALQRCGHAALPLCGKALMKVEKDAAGAAGGYCEGKIVIADLGFSLRIYCVADIIKK